LNVNRLFRHVARGSSLLWIVLVIVGLLAHASTYVRATDEGTFSIGDADHAIRLAFNAALNAEMAGANVSGLIVRLNEAGDLLTNAEIANSTGNLTEAESLAGQCIGIAESVTDDAKTLQSSGLAKAELVFRDTLAFSVVSIGVFVVVYMLLWRRFRRNYVMRALRTKPEVEFDEA
jgi:hypothetical protein